MCMCVSYRVELEQVQDLALHVGDLQCASLQLPELSDLIQEVELHPGLSLSQNALGDQLSTHSSHQQLTVPHTLSLSVSKSSTPTWSTGRSALHTQPTEASVYSVLNSLERQIEISKHSNVYQNVHHTIMIPLNCQSRMGIKLTLHTHQIFVVESHIAS